MKRVGDIQDPQSRLYVRFHVGKDGGVNEGEVIYGFVVGPLASGGYEIALDDGKKAIFDYQRGDRLFWMSAKPWNPARGRAVITEAHQLEVRERAAVKAEIKRMARQVEWSIALCITATSALITYAFVRDADKVIAFFTRLFS